MTLAGHLKTGEKTALAEPGRFAPDNPGHIRDTVLGAPYILPGKAFYDVQAVHGGVPLFNAYGQMYVVRFLRVSYRGIGSARAWAWHSCLPPGITLRTMTDRAFEEKGSLGREGGHESTC